MHRSASPSLAVSLSPAPRERDRPCHVRLRAPRPHGVCVCVMSPAGQELLRSKLDYGETEKSEIFPPPPPSHSRACLCTQAARTPLVPLSSERHFLVRGVCVQRQGRGHPCQVRLRAPRPRDGRRCRARRDNLKGFKDLPESQGRNLALTVLYVPYLRDNGCWQVRYGAECSCTGFGGLPRS